MGGPLGGNLTYSAKLHFVYRLACGWERFAGVSPQSAPSHQRTLEKQRGRELGRGAELLRLATRIDRVPIYTVQQPYQSIVNPTQV